MGYSVDQRSPRRKEINRHLAMARVLFFAILAMCLVCMLQASPAGTDGVTERNLLKEVGDMIHTGIENAKKAGEDFANDPNVKSAVTQVVKAIQDTSTYISNEAGKLVPKTD